MCELIPEKPLHILVTSSSGKLHSARILLLHNSQYPSVFQFVFTMLQTAIFLLLVVPTWTLVNNADLIWFDNEGKPQKYVARQPYPDGFNDTKKIVVNQKFPVLWEVKFDMFDNLEELVIEECGVNEIQRRSFKDLQPLKTLSLRNNNIKDVREGIFNFVQIQNLDLGNNKIRSIADKAFDNMPLEEIILDYNELRQWSGDWFFNCSRLATISITHNFLDELPPKSFRNFGDSLRRNFYFTYNKIKRIDREAFALSGDFGDLFLDWNDFTRVGGHAFGDLKSVEHLNLIGNSLRCLSDEFINSVLNKTEKVSILENPLTCECVQELQKRGKIIKDRVEYVQPDC